MIAFSVWFTALNELLTALAIFAQIAKKLWKIVNERRDLRVFKCTLADIDSYISEILGDPEYIKSNRNDIPVTSRLDTDGGEPVETAQKEIVRDTKLKWLSWKCHEMKHFSSLSIICVDIGGTRTKFLYLKGDMIMLLPSVRSVDIWGDPSDIIELQRRLRGCLWGVSTDDNHYRSRTPDLISGKPQSDITMSILDQYTVSKHNSIPTHRSQIDVVVFSVPGSLELNENSSDDEMYNVRNMPSISHDYTGFNFKAGFSTLFTRAKIYAVPDALGAAIGFVSCINIPSASRTPYETISPRFSPKAKGLFRNDFKTGKISNLSVTCDHHITFQPPRAVMIVILGTAPAVSTYYRVGNSVELATWHNWVWFTKISLTDRYGYYGGIKRVKTSDGTKRIYVKDVYKVPHSKARIRFAVDDHTWKRLRGLHPSDDVPPEIQGNLGEEEATVIWCDRVQRVLNVLARKFRSLYGMPDVVALLGGNALRCKGMISSISVSDADQDESDYMGTLLKSPVFVPDSDEEQQMIHMWGLSQAAAHRVRHLHAVGCDTLNRGWAAGGNFYLWERRSDVVFR